MGNHSSRLEHSGSLRSVYLNQILGLILWPINDENIFRCSGWKCHVGRKISMVPPPNSCAVTPQSRTCSLPPQCLLIGLRCCSFYFRMKTTMEAVQTAKTCVFCEWNGRFDRSMRMDSRKKSLGVVSTATTRLGGVRARVHRISTSGPSTYGNLPPTFYSARTNLPLRCEPCGVLKHPQ